MKFQSIISVPFITALFVSSLSARLWTSIEGVSLEAKYISSTESTVTIQRSFDLKRFTFPLEKLSKKDQEWLKNNAAGANDTESATVYWEPSPYEGVPPHLVEIIKAKGELLLEDSFNREDSEGAESLGELWGNGKGRRVVRERGDTQCNISEGSLVLTLSPNETHPVTTTHDTFDTYSDVISWTRVKLIDSNFFKIAFNDRQYKEVHAGHINGVVLTPSKIRLDDEKNGRFSKRLYTLKKDPTKQDEFWKEASKFAQSFDVRLSNDKWIDLVTHHDGDTLTAYVNGTKAGSFTSPGFKHDTKRQISLVAGKDARVDHIRVWKIASEKGE